MSSNAPSFPLIRLDLDPVDWLSFNYFHGWLVSDVVDSSLSYSTGIKHNNRLIYRDKFIASHSITIIPTNKVRFSVGESIVYSDKLKIAYLQPLMFFRPADHFLSSVESNNAGDNVQLFFNINTRNLVPNTQIEATVFIDELNLNNIFNKSHRNQLAYQIGISTSNVLFNDLKLKLEYTRLNPFVYRHYISTQTFESSSYVLGHWIEHNSDVLQGMISYKFFRGLQCKLWSRFIRKGEDGTYDEQYGSPQPPFLFGLNTEVSQAGLDISYEIYHDFFVHLEANLDIINTEETMGKFTDSKKEYLYLSVYYGL